MTQYVHETGNKLTDFPLFISYSSSAEFSATHPGWSRCSDHCPPKPHAADGSGSDRSSICTDQHPRDPAGTNCCPGHSACTYWSAGTSHICTNYHTRNSADAISHSAATSSVRSQTWYLLDIVVMIFFFLRLVGSFVIQLFFLSGVVLADGFVANPITSTFSATQPVGTMVQAHAQGVGGGPTLVSSPRPSILRKKPAIERWVYWKIVREKSKLGITECIFFRDGCSHKFSFFQKGFSYLDIFAAELI